MTLLEIIQTAALVCSGGASPTVTANCTARLLTCAGYRSVDLAQVPVAILPERAEIRLMTCILNYEEKYGGSK